MHNKYRSRPRSTYSLTQLAALIGALLSPAVQAAPLGASFDIASGVTVTSPQKLDDNQTGVIQTGGALNVAGAIAVNAPGSAVKITNSGTLSTTGNNSRGIFTTGANAIITNSGTLSTAGNNSSEGIFSTGANAIITNHHIFAAHSAAEAARLIARENIDYVVTCKGLDDPFVADPEWRGTLRADLVGGKAPDFLEPVALANPHSLLSVWRVKRDKLNLQP